MPPKRKAGKGKKGAAPGADHASLDVLPDEVLHHVLSFLPAQEAVRTCVLARRWRHLWRFASGLRILCGGENEAASMNDLWSFVEHLFLLRGGSPLDTCHFSLLNVYDDDDDLRRIQLWIRHIVMCKVQVSYGQAPVLERMPSLLEAMVEIDTNCTDCCHRLDGGYSDDENCPCHGVRGDTDCVVLQGLSEVQSLVLISDFRMFIFRRDLKCFSVFSNLKTLSLDEYWCVPADFSALTSILEHSPVLEKLTLHLFCKEPKSKVQMKGSPDPTERSNALPEHLKVVEVRCDLVDDRVLNVLEFLNKLGIYSYRFQFGGTKSDTSAKPV